MKKRYTQGQIEWLHGTLSKATVRCTRCLDAKEMPKVVYLVHAKTYHRSEWDNYWSDRPTAVSIPEDILNQEGVL